VDSDEGGSPAAADINFGSVPLRRQTLMRKQTN